METTYKNIVIATDGTEYIKKAIDAGLEIAELTGAIVHAIYVTDSPSVSPTSSEWEMVEKNIKKEIDEAMKYIREESIKRNITLKEVSVEGNPAPEIINYSNVINADLIVVGAT